MILLATLMTIRNKFPDILEKAEVTPVYKQDDFGSGPFGPWLLNIFVNDTFFAKNSTLFNYGDDNTQFSWEKTFNQVINNLQTDFRKLLKVWSYDNFLVLNPNQCHFMTLGNGYNIWNFAQDDIIIKNSLSEIILGLTIGNILDFSGHISNICRSVNQKLNALFRVSANMNSNNCSLILLLTH